MVTYWYPRTHLGRSTQPVKPGRKLFGIPFARWNRYVGQSIDLSRWRGTAPGMIGGPKKVRIAIIMSNKQEYGLYENVADAEQTIRQWRADLRDERVQYEPYARSAIADNLRIARRFIREAKKHK